MYLYSFIKSDISAARARKGMEVYVVSCAATLNLQCDS